MVTTKRKFWQNQAIVCVSDKTSLKFGETYQIHSMHRTTDNKLVFFLVGYGMLHAYHNTMFIPKLDWLDIEQQVYELFYQN